MSEVALENVPVEMNTPSPRRESSKHWVNKSIEDIADEYFSSISPFAEKIVLEKQYCKDQQREWDRFDQREKDEVIDDWFMDASLKLKYELKLGIIEPKKPGVESFPRRVVQGGNKTVQYREEDQDGGNGTGKYSSWKDEFSGPFSWETKCQQELSVLSSEATSSSTPRHESTTSEALLDPSQPIDQSLLRPRKSTGEEDACSIMVMKDVTKRRSFGNNLLASLEERLAFDQSVSDANDKKKDDKTFQHIGHIDNKYIHAGELDKKSSQSTPQETRRKTSDHGYKKKVSKPKMAPPGPGPKARDIPKYTDPPIYHKSQTLPNLPKFNEPPKYASNIEPPSQTMDRGRSSVESPKPKVSKPKVEPPKPRVEKPKMEPPKPRVEKPKMEPPKPRVEKPKMEPPKPRVEKPKMEPPKPRVEKPKMQPPEPLRQISDSSSGSISPRQPVSPREIDREKLLPQTPPSAAAKESMPTSTSHDNLSLEDDDGDNSKASTTTGGGDGDQFDFLMAW